MVSKDEKRWRAAAHIVMIVLSALAILPFILLIIASFTDEDVALYVDFPTASLMTDGDIFSVTDSYLIAKIISNVAESNKKAWIYSML